MKGKNMFRMPDTKLEAFWSDKCTDSSGRGGESRENQPNKEFVPPCCARVVPLYPYGSLNHLSFKVGPASPWQDASPP